MAISRKLVAFFVIGIVLIYAMLELLGLAEILAVLATVNVWLLLLAVAVHFATVGVLVLRIRTIGGPGQLRTYAKSTIAGLFVNFITPIAKVGGEPVKILMLRRHLGGSKASAAVVLDTFVEILSSYITFLVIVVLFFFLIPPLLFPYYIVFLVVVLVSSLVFLKVSLTPVWLTRLVNFFVKKLSRFVRIRRKDYATMFHTSFTLLIRNKHVMVSSLSLSFAGKILEFLRIWLVFLALGVTLPWSVVLVVWAFLLILLVVPWLPGGLGLVEAGTIAAFTAMGINVHVAATAVVLDRLVWFWLVLFIGAVITTKYAADAKEARGRKI